MRKLLAAVALVAALLSANQAFAFSAGLIGIQKFNSAGTTTFTPDAGTTSVLVILCGAGAGSSGITSPGSTKLSVGAHGGGGGCTMKWMNSGFSGTSLTIGAGGNGGASGNNNGSVGGDSTFSGQTGGGGQAALGCICDLSQSALTGGNSNDGGVATGGDLNIPGQGTFTRLITIVANTPREWERSGLAGRSWLGGLSYAENEMTTDNATFPAQAGLSCGEGGMGGMSNNSGAAQAGAAGHDGCAVFLEFGSSLLQIDFVTAAGTTTHTPNGSTTKELVLICGSGGGGAGVVAGSGSYGGESGSGAACSIKLMTTGFSGASLVVGAGGAGGAIGSNSGSAGNTSSFNGVSVSGGTGGTQRGTSNVTQPTAGAAKGSNGDYDMSGGGTWYSIASAGTGTGTSPGGTFIALSSAGWPLSGHANSNHAGHTGYNCGGGGEGATMNNNGTGAAGGTGGAGCAVIFEFQ